MTRRARAGLVLAVLVGATAGCSGDDAPEADERPSPTTAAPTASLYDLEIGDCFSGLARNRDLRIRLQPCNRRHQAEVYGTLELDNRRFPGADVLRRRTATFCAQAFVGYTGEPVGPGTEVAFTEVVPTLESFTAGDRRALCVAHGLDGVPLRRSNAQRSA